MFKRLWSSWVRPWLGRVRWKDIEVLRGLGAPVECRTEPHGIPHIFAHNEEDLFRAQGFLTARDRLFQIDIMRRTAAGRLSELYGDIAGIGLDNTLNMKGQGLASVDYLMRVLGLAESAREGLSWLSPQTHHVLTAYSEGVNEWIAHAKKTGKLSFGYNVLGEDPEEWRPTDSLLVLRLLAFQLSFTWRLQLGFGALCHKLAETPERLHALLPSHLDLSLQDVDQFLEWSQQQDPLQANEAPDAPTSSTIFPSATGQGSCAWVVGGQHTQSGQPLLCNDPHLTLRLPSAFYQTRLSAGRYNVIGIAIPGHPGVYAGHNEQIAWGASLSRLDDSDIFIEDIDPTGQRYRHKGRWIPLIRREEVIKVRGDETQHRWVRSTSHGPLLSDALRGPMPSHLNYSLAWTGHEGTRESEAILQLNRAQHWDHFREALRHARVPSLGFVYADRKNNIGAVIAGRSPRRPQSPRLFHPLLAADDTYNWEGDIPYEDMPYQYNPPEGMLILSGQRPPESMEGANLQGLWEPDYRANRITNLLQKAMEKPITPERMARLQRDHYCLWTSEFIDTYLRPYESKARLTPPVAQAFNNLLQWNGNYGARSLAAPYFAKFQVKLFEQTYLNHLGEDLYRRWIDIAHELGSPVEALFRNDDCWLDRPRDAVLHYALTQAYHTLQSRLGNNPEEWTWSRTHRLHLRPLLFWGGNYQESLARGPLQTGGAHQSLNTGNFSWVRPFEHRVGAAARQIIDVGHWDQSRWVLCGGQGEDPRSPHYDDQLVFWTSGDHIAMAFSARNLLDTTRWMLPKASSGVPSQSLALSAPNTQTPSSPSANGNP